MKLAGANAIRALRDAEAVAAEIQQRRGPSLATYADLDGATASGGTVSGA